jgi:hypothetical protein
MEHLRKMRPYALGASVTILADRIIDVGSLEYAAWAVIVCLAIGGAYLGRRLYA